MTQPQVTEGLLFPEENRWRQFGRWGAVLNAMIAAAQAAPAITPTIVLSQVYQLEQTVIVPPGPAVNFWFTGAMNRQGATPFPVEGGALIPAADFPAGAPLMQLGTTGNSAANPNGTTLYRPVLSGATPAGATISSCIGLQVNDTADVHLIDPYMANFDLVGAAGTCAVVNGSVTGAAWGFTIQGGFMGGNSWKALLMSGAGATDARLTGTIYHGSKIMQLATGGGTQIVGNHFVSIGGSGSYELLASTECFVTGNYFDAGAGNNPVVQLQSANGGIFTDNHFLADASNNGPLCLITAASQYFVFCNNQARGNGSSITAMMKTNNHAGAPTGGTYTGNFVANAPGTLVGVLIDSANAAIPATATATAYVQGNVAAA